MSTGSAGLLSTRPLVGALLAQVLGSLLAAIVLVVVLPEMLDAPLVAAAIQGGCAAIVSHRLRAPSWWQAIHLVFLPLLALASRLGLPPWFWLSGFVILLLVFWRTDRSRVPLYLTNATTADRIAMLLPPTPCFVLDIGCGDGGLIRHLARLRADCEFVGIEHAPLTWLWARLASLGFDNVQIRYGDFWQPPFTPYDFVYAFLSPAPMTRLWEKARDEMRPGTLLISNSFAVPGLPAEKEIGVADRRASKLFCYRIPG